MQMLTINEVNSVSGAGGGGTIWGAVVGWVVSKVLDYESAHLGQQMGAYAKYYQGTGGLAAYGY